MTDTAELFKPSEMASILSAAILEKMSQDDRAALLAQAIQYLITPGKSKDYGRTPGDTPLQESFNIAASQALREVARQIIDADTAFQAKLRALVHEAMDAVITDNYMFQNKLTEAMVEAFSKLR